MFQPFLGEFINQGSFNQILSVLIIMAFIFEKSGSLENEQCLVLGVREPLVYPFIGSGVQWHHIMISYYYSFCGTGSGNAIPVDETVFGRATNSEKAAFWGIKDSGKYYPFQTGVFVGRGAPTGSISVGNECYYNPGSETFALNHPGGAEDRVMISVGTGRRDSLAPKIDINSPANNITLDNYCAYFSQKFIAEPNIDGKYSIKYYEDFSRNIAAPYNLTGIRSRGLNTATWTLRQTGMITSDLTAEGSFVPLPNTLFIYMPLIQNRIRIHQLLVELVD